MSTFVIDSLSKILKAFNLEDCEAFSNYCIVALENNKHSTGCLLKVLGDQEKEFRLEWTKQFKKARYVEETEITKNAAEAISFFLSKELTPYSIVYGAKIGTGIDYWMGFDEDDERYNAKNFIQARIEISGINEESKTNTVAGRNEIKRKQSNKSDSTGYPAYISIVELKTPWALFEKK